MGDKNSDGDIPMNEIEEDILHADDDVPTCAVSIMYNTFFVYYLVKKEVSILQPFKQLERMRLSFLKILSDQGIFAVPLNYLIIIINIIQGNV